MKQLVFAAFLLLFAAVVFQTTSCYYDNEKDLYGTTTCDTAAVSYSTDIQPIIDANCVRCHAPGGEQEGTPIQNYDELKAYVADNVLVDRVTGVGSIMPPDGKMSNCNISLIQAWINAGTPNN